MVSRRQFLCSSGLAAAACCAPASLAASRPVAGLRIPPQPTPLQAMQGLPSQAHRMLGYPINMATPPDGFFRWRNQLAKVGVNRFAFNNVGDPFKESHIPFNTHAMEKELISRFARLYGLDPDKAWGFLSHSGTDSNMHGMYMGRTILKQRTGVIPRAFFTREAHYSVQILRDLLALDWVEVDTNTDGSMNMESLSHELNNHRDVPALVVATIGTTFKGAIDSVDEIRACLGGHDAYLHVDAALFGGYLPHTSDAQETSFAVAKPTPNLPQLRYDSLAVSCHKFFGLPSPAGLFLTPRRTFEAFHQAFGQVHDPAYIHQVPGTITCSRDAVKPAEFLFFSSETAFKQQRQDAQDILRNTNYLFSELKSRFAELNPTRANLQSNTIYFRNPGDRIVNKYSLATMNLSEGTSESSYAHVVVMPHAKRQVLDQFLDDLKKEGSL